MSAGGQYKVFRQNIYGYIQGLIPRAGSLEVPDIDKHRNFGSPFDISPMPILKK